MPLQGDRLPPKTTQGDALGYELLPLQGVWGKIAKSKVSIMYARVECYFLYKGGDVLHHDSRKP